MKSLTQPLIYGLPAWPLAMLGIPLYVYLPAYYHQLGVSLTSIGLMLFIARITDLITDPIIGLLRDRISHKNRYGLILTGWLLLLIGLWPLFQPTNPSAFHLLFWAAWVYLSWTLIMISYQSLSAELTDDVHRKTLFISVREGFAIVGVVTVLILPFALAQQDDYQTLFQVLYGLVALTLTGFLGWMIWRLNLLPVHPKTAVGWQAFKRVWQDAQARHLWPAYFLNSLANALPATLFVLFVEHYLDLTAQTGLLLLSFFIAGILALPFWIHLSKKIGKYQAWQGSIWLACLSFGWVFILEPGMFWAFLLISFVSGLSLGADVALPSSIQTDIAQRLSQQDGAVNGLLFGIWGMLTKLALALAIGLAFPILDLLGWQDKTEQSLFGLMILYAGLPIAIKIAVLIWLKRAKPHF